jgi:hypothetical protein
MNLLFLHPAGSPDLAPPHPRKDPGDTHEQDRCPEGHVNPIQEGTRYTSDKALGPENYLATSRVLEIVRYDRLAARLCGCTG